MKFSVLSIHPEMLEAFFSEGLLAKARAKSLLQIAAINIRDYADPPHFKVDESPYGGGAGMVLKCEPIVRAIRAAQSEKLKSRVIVLSAKGKKFTQAVARRWLKYEHLILVAGRYEGIDERVIANYADEEVRIGDFVLMGGEVAASVIVETVGRLVPGVLGNPNSLEDESFSPHLLHEYQQYTRPSEFEGLRVPEVLLKGNHALIQKWRTEVSTPKLKRRV